MQRGPGSGLGAASVTSLLLGLCAAEQSLPDCTQALRRAAWGAPLLLSLGWDKDGRVQRSLTQLWYGIHHTSEIHHTTQKIEPSESSPSRERESVNRLLGRLVPILLLFWGPEGWIPS